MLAVAFPCVAARRERLAVARRVLLVVVVLHSGLRVLQCPIVLVGVVSSIRLQLVRGDPIGVDMKVPLVLPYKLWNAAELPVVFESGPLLLDGFRLPLVLVNVRICFTTNP